MFLREASRLLQLENLTAGLVMGVFAFSSAVRSRLRSMADACAFQAGFQLRQPECDDEVWPAGAAIVGAWADMIPNTSETRLRSR